MIALVVVLFASVENLRRFGETGASIGDILRITLLQAPEVLYQVFPLVLMLASLVTFLRLARTSELVVMRAAGVSALRLIGVPVLAAIVLGRLRGGGEPLRRRLDQARARARGRVPRRGLQPALLLARRRLAAPGRPRGGQTVIQAARTNADGTILSRVRMHRFDEDGTLYARIEAPAARLTPGAWVLENGHRMGAARRRALRAGRRRQTASSCRPTLTSDQILESFSPPETVGFWDLGRFIPRWRTSGFSGQRHRLFLQSELAKPALFAAMVLIGAAFALRPPRFGQTGVMILLAVLAGFALYFLKDFAESLGARGQIPLLVAAWTPPVAAILLALSLLLHLEDG